MDNRLGRVVDSIAGRDKGSLLVVVGVVDENHLLLADGGKRKLERPKKKKIKHIVFTDICFEDIRTKLEKHDKITNADLRKALKSTDVVELVK